MATLTKIPVILNKDQVITLDNLVSWLSDRYTSPEALAFYKKNKKLIKIYFPNLKINNDDYSLISDLIECNINSALLNSGIRDGKKTDIWYDKFNLKEQKSEDNKKIEVILK